MYFCHSIRSLIKVTCGLNRNYRLCHMGPAKHWYDHCNNWVSSIAWGRCIGIRSEEDKYFMQTKTKYEVSWMTTQIKGKGIFDRQLEAARPPNIRRVILIRNILIYRIPIREWRRFSLSLWLACGGQIVISNGAAYRCQPNTISNRFDSLVVCGTT